MTHPALRLSQDQSVDLILSEWLNPLFFSVPSQTVESCDAPIDSLLSIVAEAALTEGDNGSGCTSKVNENDRTNILDKYLLATLSSSIRSDSLSIRPSLLHLRTPYVKMDTFEASITKRIGRRTSLSGACLKPRINTLLYTEYGGDDAIMRNEIEDEQQEADHQEHEKDAHEEMKDLKQRRADEKQKQKDDEEAKRDAQNPDPPCHGCDASTADTPCGWYWIPCIKCARVFCAGYFIKYYRITTNFQGGPKPKGLAKFEFNEEKKHDFICPVCTNECPCPQCEHIPQPKLPRVHRLTKFPCSDSYKRMILRNARERRRARREKMRVEREANRISRRKAREIRSNS